MAVKPTCVNRAAIQALRRHLEPRGIYVVTQTARQCVAFRSWGHDVHCHLQVSPEIPKKRRRLLAHTLPQVAARCHADRRNMRLGTPTNARHMPRTICVNCDGVEVCTAQTHTAPHHTFGTGRAGACHSQRRAPVRAGVSKHSNV